MEMVEFYSPDMFLAHRVACKSCSLPDEARHGYITGASLLDVIFGEVYS